MSFIVRKFGGACFANRECLLRVARQVLAGDDLPVVIVVSEEDGTTSIARGGGLKREMAPNEVMSFLRGLPS